jgi:hypothetical protein
LSRHPLGSSALIIAFHKERKVPMKHTVQRLLGTPAAMSLVLLFFSICSSSCDKFKGDTGPAGPKLTGNLIGYVTLYDDYGRKLPDNSTVTITVENSDKATTSDISGKWTITELATGSYTLTFSKTGFGVYKRIGLGFTGGGDLFYGRSQFLMAIPAFTVSSLVATPTTSSVTISGSISSAPSAGYVHYVRFFIGTSSSVSSNPTTFLFSYLSSGTSTTAISTSITSSTFNRAGISSGSTVYLIAYASANSTYFDDGTNFLDTGYSDPATGKTIYPNIGTIPSNTVSFLVP